MISKQWTRRGFFRLGAMAVPMAAAAITGLHSIKAYSADTALKFVGGEDPVAKALGYVADASKASATDRKDKGGVKAKDQLCNNCALYTKHANIDGKEAGKCTMIQGGSVAGKGWCKSWIAKAK